MPLRRQHRHRDQTATQASIRSRLLVNADIALYRAKSRGRNRYEFFTEALQAEIVNTKRIADEILSGLERNEFIAYYQPQFDARTLDIVGVEALARWNHPTEGHARARRLPEDRRGAQRRRDHRPRRSSSRR